MPNPHPMPRLEPLANSPESLGPYDRRHFYWNERAARKGLEAVRSNLPRPLCMKRISEKLSYLINVNGEVGLR